MPETLAGLFLLDRPPRHVIQTMGRVHRRGCARVAAVSGCGHSVHSTGSPWENGYNKSFNGKLRDDLLNGEIFCTRKEAHLIARTEYTVWAE